MPKFEIRSSVAPFVVDAMQWNGDGARLDAMLEWASEGKTAEQIAMADHGCGIIGTVGGHLQIIASDGDLTIRPGDWVIRRGFGDLQSCTRALFEEMFRPMVA